MDSKLIANAKEYYSRKEVQKELIRLSEDREVQAWFGEFRGIRPEVVNFEGDVKDLVKQGMTSFHISEERWKDPTILEAGLRKKELDNFRSGWDCILDLDSKNLEFSLITGELLIEALKFHNVKNYSLKYSGNRGLHIAIPFEAFPKEVNNVNIKDYFPEGVRVISSYLKSMIQEFLTAKLLSKGSLNDIAKSIGKTEDQLIVNGKFDPYQAVDIDSVLISSRHLFRCAYSINEKSGLVSIPLKNISDFNIDDAKIENVKVNIKFLDRENVVKDEAKELLIQAFDWAKKETSVLGQEIRQQERRYEVSKVAIKPEFFPACITKLMRGLKEDGRKRGVFILCNFLTSVGWNFEEIENFLLEWNKRNAEPLRDGYIKAQVSWFKRQNKKVLPPNCDNVNYYKAIGIKCEDSICNMCKNPVNYTYRMVKMKEKKKIK
ncbi:MAG TPA: hypothetical protein VJG30_02465 [Candidatus Nanoarchaeia archaeon]|nr:hypothetical protein [Candidatus Nanoarchaeia archaeon]